MINAVVLLLYNQYAVVMQELFILFQKIHRFFVQVMNENTHQELSIETLFDTFQGIKL